MKTDPFAPLREGDAPPLRVDLDDVLAAGRRRVRVRRVLAAGAAAMSVVAVAGVVAVVARPHGAAPPPTVAGGPRCRVERLPVPEGKTHATVTAVDPTGRFVAGAVPGSEETGEQGAALLWQDGRLIALDVGHFAPTPSGVNASGAVVGTATTAEHRQIAWAYRDGKVRILPGIEGHEMVAGGIDERGDIAGTAHGPGDVTTAVVWPVGEPGRVRQLDAPGSAGALAMAADGTIVGYADGGHPYLWDTRRQGRALPELPGPATGAARAVAGDWAAGYSGTPEGGGQDTPRSRPVRWNLRDNRVEDLPGMEASGITATGAVVGVTTATAPQPPYREAVLRDGDRTTYLPHVSGARNYDAALAVNADGTVIAGELAADGSTTPVLWRC